MGRLAKCNAGAEVKFHRLFTDDEVEQIEGDPALYSLEVSIKDVDQDGDVVTLDGWAE